MSHGVMNNIEEKTLYIFCGVISDVGFLENVSLENIKCNAGISIDFHQYYIYYIILLNNNYMQINRV